MAPLHSYILPPREGFLGDDDDDGDDDADERITSGTFILVARSGVGRAKILPQTTLVPETNPSAAQSSVSERSDKTNIKVLHFSVCPNC